MIFMLIVLVCIVTNAMDRMDYERSAQEKKERYIAFVQVMNMLENSEECISDLADRRQLPQLHVETMYRIVEEPDSPIDYVILRREDFEGA
jgi:hypothetical protein